MLDYWARHDNDAPQSWGTEPNASDVPAHLGGHWGFTNVDYGTLDYLVDRYTVRSLIDVGCGVGGMVDYAAGLGLEAVGIDGDSHCAEHPLVHEYDYTEGPLGWPPVDLVWSVEFVEHVDEIYVPNFLETFRAGATLFFTHATPGQGGHHHVNCRDGDYWAALLDRDWVIDSEATDIVRTNSRVAYIEATGQVWTRR